MTEELAFGGGHVMKPGDIVKWVPHVQGHCAGYDGPEFGGALGIGIDGWGTLVTSVTLNAGASPYVLCIKATDAADFALQPHVRAIVTPAPPSPPPSPAPPNLAVVARGWVLSAVPYCLLAFAALATLAAALYVTAARGDPHRFQMLVEESMNSVTNSAEMSAKKLQEAAENFSRLSALEGSPIRNLSADLAEEAQIRRLARTPPSATRSPRRRFVASFSFAPKSFAPVDLALPCCTLLLVFALAFALLVLIPSFTFGVELLPR